jgi:hypothetical protein
MSPHTSLLVGSRQLKGRTVSVRRGKGGKARVAVFGDESGVLQFAHWHMTQALKALSDPSPWPDIAKAITGVLRPLNWRDEGARNIEAVLDELHRAGVIHIPGYTPPPDPVIPEPRPGDYRPRCAWCGKPCKTLRSKYCSRSHSQMAYMGRKAAKASS